MSTRQETDGFTEAMRSVNTYRQRYFRIVIFESIFYLSLIFLFIHIKIIEGNGLNPSESNGVDNSSKTCANQIIINEPQFEEYGDNSRESMLKQYHLLLQSIEMERRLGENNIKTTIIVNNNATLILRFE